MKVGSRGYGFDSEYFLHFLHFGSSIYGVEVLAGDLLPGKVAQVLPEEHRREDGSGPAAIHIRKAEPGRGRKESGELKQKHESRTHSAARQSTFRTRPVLQITLLPAEVPRIRQETKLQTLRKEICRTFRQCDHCAA
jgi:hypothetical protein